MRKKSVLMVAAERLLILGGCALPALFNVPHRAAADDPQPPLVNTTLQNFFMPGTQPDPSGAIVEPLEFSGNCQICHGYFAPKYNQPLEGEPYRNWAGSMKAQASRDPIFYACLTIANQDAAESGDLCIRCHSPGAWLSGRSTPTDASEFNQLIDFDGVNCHFCHRMVDPTYDAKSSPPEDIPILYDLSKQDLLPVQAGSGQYVVDPSDVRRGPFSDENWPYNPHGFNTPIIVSPFHRSSEMCATCHDVSNPLFTRQLDGSYDPNEAGVAHATMDKYDMFPIERTYSEWSESQFAAGGVQLFGRFGGNHPTGVMQTCQDCHMPDVASPGCNFPQDELGFPEIHPDMPQHAFNGGNTWVLHAVQDLYDEFETGLSNDVVADAMARVAQSLEDASDVQLSQDGNRLSVRIINYTGHKLPTGYPEGRRMWINVQFRNAGNVLIVERGAYDFETADLTAIGTKVYEAKLGLDADMSKLSGLPAGESFHFALNNTIVQDNRIPPIGFTNSGFDSVQAAPVGASYADGQHWDDTDYAIPLGAASATVRLYYQTTSKEYIEFLRDENKTDNRGDIAHAQWELHGKSEPVLMDEVVIKFTRFVAADLNNDGTVNASDLALLLGLWGPCPACPADFNNNGEVDAGDLAQLLGSWG